MTATPGPDRWQAWSPEEVAARLAGVTAPWCVVGGWALDLFAGHQRRPHEDLEIAVPSTRFPEVAERLADCELHVPEDGVLRPLGSDPDQLDRSHQTWVRSGGWWRLDVMREPTTTRSGQELWVCRRDPALALPYPEVVRRDRRDVPYLRPDLVLLFKAKALRPKDQEDFDRTVPALSPPDRSRLGRWVRRVHGDDHPWVAALSSEGALPRGRPSEDPGSRGGDVPPDEGTVGRWGSR